LKSFFYRCYNKSKRSKLSFLHQHYSLVMDSHYTLLF